MDKFVKQIKLFKNVIWALFIKELKVKYSNQGYLTYFWVVGDPLIQILILLGIYTILMNRAGCFGLPVQLVLITGMIPFRFFSESITNSINTVDANLSLLCYKQVSIFSTIISRILVAAITSMSTFVILYLLFYFLGYKYAVHNFIIIFLSIVLLIFFTLGVSLIVCTIGFFFQEAKVVVTGIIRVMFFISGVIFDISIIPEKIRHILLFNPIMQSLGLIRSGFLNDKFPQGGRISLEYLFISTLFSMFLGIIVYFIARKSFIKQARARA